MENTTIIGGLIALATSLAGTLAYLVKKGRESHGRSSKRPTTRDAPSSGGIKPRDVFELLTRHADEDVEILQRIAGTQEGFVGAAQTNGERIEDLRDEIREARKEIGSLRDLLIEIKANQNHGS